MFLEQKTYGYEFHGWRYTIIHINNRPTFSLAYIVKYTFR